MKSAHKKRNALAWLLVVLLVFPLIPVFQAFAAEELAIEITRLPDKLVYKVGDALDLTGLEVTGTNGVTSQVMRLNDRNVAPANGRVLDAEGEIEVVVSIDRRQINDFVPGQVIVGLKYGVEFSKDDPFVLFPELSLSGVRDLTLNSTGIKKILRLDLEEETKKAVVEAVELLKDNPNVEYAQPNSIFYLDLPPVRVINPAYLLSASFTVTVEPVVIDPEPDSVSVIPVQYYYTGGGVGYRLGSSKILSTGDLKEYYDGAPLRIANGNGQWWNAFHSRRPVNSLSMAEGVFFNEAYNDAFFESKFLLFASLIESSGSTRHIVDSLVIGDDGITVNITAYPGMTADIGDYHIVFELPVSLKDLPVKVIRTYIPWHSGIVFNQLSTAPVIRVDEPHVVDVKFNMVTRHPIANGRSMFYITLDKEVPGLSKSDITINGISAAEDPDVQFRYLTNARYEMIIPGPADSVKDITISFEKDGYNFTPKSRTVVIRVDEDEEDEQEEELDEEELDVPITLIKINAAATETVKRGGVYNYGLILNKGATAKNIIWTVSDPTFAMVDNAGNVYILNKTGTVRLVATDPVSLLSHSISLRIAS